MEDNLGDTSLLIDYITHPWRQVDDSIRDRLIATCQDVIASLETPLEAARKNSFLTLDHAVVRSAIQLNAFELLASREKPWATQDLAAATLPPCDVSLLSRLLRYLASPLRLVVEEGPGLWKVTRRGRAFADPKLKSVSSFDSCGPIFQALPSWVSADSSKRAASPFKSALPDENSFFDWLQKDNLKLREFHAWMETLTQHQASSQKSVDLSIWTPEKISDNEVAFVDIAGGNGRQCIEVQENRGSVPGRIVKQDSEEVVQTTRRQLEEKGIEVMVHNIFDSQPVKGAHVYHFRQVFHEWPDQDAVKILERTKEAMIASSTLLIDEVVLPEQGAHWTVTQSDLTALALFNAGERSEAQWRALLTQVGLRVEEIYCYNARTATCLIVAKLG
ncbi:O-methyltransferase-domain-containing protein [Biscogniauxia marginata]|nr:O-methyltransferase-domain-containing protein [Biscogniauxia marginata]